MEHRLGQLVRLVEDQKRRIHLYHVVQDQAPDFTDIVPVRLDPDLLGDLTHEVALLHVLGAKDIENLLVLFRVKACRRRLSASGLADHPRHVAPALGVIQHIAYFLISGRFHDLPAGFDLSAAYLRGDLAEHIVRNILILAVHDTADRADTGVLQAARCLVLARIFGDIGAKALADHVFLFAT